MFLDDLKEAARARFGIDIRTHKYAVIDCIIRCPWEVHPDLLGIIDRRNAY